LALYNLTIQYHSLDIENRQVIFIDVALVYAVLSYIATLYIARYLVKRRVGLV